MRTQGKGGVRLSVMGFTTRIWNLKRPAGKSRVGPRQRCNSGSSTKFKRNPGDDDALLSVISEMSDSRSSALPMAGSHQYSTTQGCMSASSKEESAELLLAPPPLSEVLQNKSKEPMSLASFLRFARRNLMDENVLFYLEVSSFKSAGGGLSEYLTHVKRIHDLYIMSTSPRQVNISGDIQMITLAAVDAVSNGRPANVRGRCTAPKAGGPTNRNSLKVCGHNQQHDEGHTAKECSQPRCFRAGTTGMRGGKLFEGEFDGEEGGSSNHTRPSQASQEENGRDGLPRQSAMLSGGNHRLLHRWDSWRPKHCDTAAPTLSSGPPIAPPDGDRMESAIISTRFRTTRAQTEEGTHLREFAEAPGTVHAERARARSLAKDVWGAGKEEEKREKTNNVEQDEGEGASARNRYNSYDDYEWPDRPRGLGFGPGWGLGSSVQIEGLDLEIRWPNLPRELGAKPVWGADSNVNIEELGVEIGPGGGVGDRAIFNSAQNEIYNVLKTDVYPKFVADVFARSRDSPPMSFSTKARSHRHPRPSGVWP